MKGFIADAFRAAGFSACSTYREDRSRTAPLRGGQYEHALAIWRVKGSSTDVDSLSLNDQAR